MVSNKVSKTKGKVLLNGNTFLRKKIHAILKVEVVKYVSLIINGWKVSNGSKIKRNGLNAILSFRLFKPKIYNCKESEKEKKKLKVG